MKIISIFNQKGGVGKTITSVNLATCLALEGKKVLLVDLDAQSNSTKNFDRYNPNTLSVYDLLIDESVDIIDTIQDTEVENLDIIPSNIKLITAENQILNDTMRSRENRLKNALRGIESDYDFCIIDCPPTLGILIINALTASNDVISPIKVDKFALDGFQNLMDTIESVKREFNSDLNFMGVLITMDRATRVNKEVKGYLKENLGDMMFKTTIRDNTAVTQSTFEYMPVVIYSNKSNASKDYFEFTKEVISNVQV
ncbi:MAG: ParA family protein [Bacilli bacterium]